MRGRGKRICWVVIISLLLSYGNFLPDLLMVARASGDPVITSISPTTVKMADIEQGVTLAINGANLAPLVGEVLTVRIGNRSAGYIGATANRITCTVPAQEDWGTYPVVLEYRVEGEVVRRSSDSIALRYISNPQINRITPNEGPGFGGSYVVIDGENFDPQGVTVRFGTRTGINAVVNTAGTQITVYTPDVPSSEIDTVNLGVTVINNDGGRAETSGTSENRFYRYRTSNPQITLIQRAGDPTGPLEGSMYGGTRLVLEGKEIQREAGVYIGNREAVKERVETRVEEGQVITRITFISPRMDPQQSLGAKDIKVMNPYDNREIVANKQFTYYKTPFVSGVNPWQHIVDQINPEGLELFITGENFKEGLEVWLDDDIQLEVKDIDFTTGTIRAIIPQGIYPTGYALRLTVHNDPGNPNSKDWFTREGTFTFLSQHSNPTITSISPSIGSTGGKTLVTITGTQFMDSNNVRVRFGDKYGEVVSSLPDRLVVSTPRNNLGIVNVYVENSDGGTAVQTGGFKYKDNLINVTGIIPSEFWIDRVEDLLVYVTNLANKPKEGDVSPQGNVVTDVRIVISYLHNNGQLAQLELRNELFHYIEKDGKIDRIQAETRFVDYLSVPDSLWNVDADFHLRIKYDDGFEEILTLPGAVRFKTPPSQPVITRVYDAVTGENFGPLTGGNTVYIEGEYFSDSQSNRMKIYFGDMRVPDGNIGHSVPVPGQAGVWRIPVVVPPSVQAGLVPVRVENPDGGRSPLYYGYIYRDSGLEAYLITPDSGPLNEEGFEVVITGRNFAQYLPDNYPGLEDYLKSNTRILFGNQYEGRIKAISDRQMTVVVPRISIEGEYEVTITNPYGTTVCQNKFRVMPLISEPIISGLTPLEGSRLGGDSITLIGSGFQVDARVEVGGKPATGVQVISNREIRAITPPGTIGYATVKVINPDGGSDLFYPANEGERFKYTSHPIIDGVSPTKIVVERGNFLTIIGQDLIFQGPGDGEETLQVESVKLDDIDLDVYHWWKENGKDVFIVQVTPETGDLGKKLHLTLTNRDGGTVTVPNAVEVVHPSTSPRLTHAEPNEGSCYDETDVLLYGSSLLPGVKVYFVDPVTKVAREAMVESVNQAGSIVKIKAPSFPLKANTNERTVDIIVMNIDKPGSFTLQDGFTYKRPSLSPIVSAIHPPEGPTLGGVQITVTGWNFVVSKGGNDEIFLPKLYFVDSKGMKQATEVKLYDQNDRELPYGNDWDGGRQFGVTIKAILPPHTEGIKDVVVVNPDTGIGRLEKGFTYRVVKDMPELNLIIPAKGPDIGGQKVNLYGAKFQPGATVTFGTQPALNVKVVNGGNIEVTTPAGVLGKVDVTVRNPDGGSATLVQGYEYTVTIPSDQAPVIDAVVPGSGSTEGGTDITIYGRNFKSTYNNEDIVVYVGNGIATDVKVYRYNEQNQLVEVTQPGEKGTMIRAKTPRGTAGTTYVAVMNPDGGYIHKDDCFTYVAGTISKPELISIVPSKGRVSGGTPIQLEGIDVRPGAKLFIGSREATHVQVVEVGTIENGRKKTIITGFTPQGTLGIKDIAVINPDQGSFILEDAFTYIANPSTNPAITGVNPNEGRTTGGTEVTIQGTGFKAGQLVFIGGRLASVIGVTGSTITVKTPPGTPGPKDIYVVDPNDGGLAFMPNGYNYVDIGGPTITNIDPNEGPTKGGQQITITGTNYDQGAKVKIGNVYATIVNQPSSTSLIVRTPENDIGTYDVTVENPDGTSYTMANGYRYFGAPKAPGGLIIERLDGNNFRIKWDPVVGADYYELYGRKRWDGDYQFIGSTKETYYIVKDLDRDTWYSFMIRAVNRHGSSEESYTGSYSSYQSSTPYVPPFEVAGRVSYQSGMASYQLGTTELSGGWGEYTVDLSNPSYQGAKVHQLNIPGSVVSGFGRQIFFKTDLVHVKLHPRALNTYEFMQLYPAHPDTHGAVVVRKLDDREEERLLRYLPRNMVQVSPVLNIGGEAVSKHRELGIPSFSQSVSLGLMADPKMVGTNYTMNFQTYYFNPQRMVWEPVGSKTTWYRTPSTLTTMRSGQYVLLAERR